MTPKAKTLLPSLILAVVVLTPISRTAMSFLLPDRWQISGYYLDGLVCLLILVLFVSWLASIILHVVRREYMRSVDRLMAGGGILFLGLILGFGLMHFTPSRISGWPIDSVYSSTRGKYYILAYEPIPTDTCYRIFSTDATRLNPVWEAEFPRVILDYSEDGSLIENPGLILSGDEQLLVIKRGGHLTDAIVIDSSQALTEFVPWSDENREQQWRRRTDRIDFLLKEHSAPAARP